MQCHCIPLVLFWIQFKSFDLYVSSFKLRRVWSLWLTYTLSEGICPFQCQLFCNVCVIASMFSPAAEPARWQCLSWCNRQLILSLCKRLTSIQMTCRWDRELRFWQDSVITRNVFRDNVLSAFWWLKSCHFSTEDRLEGAPCYQLGDPHGLT